MRRMYGLQNNRLSAEVLTEVPRLSPKMPPNTLALIVPLVRSTKLRKVGAAVLPEMVHGQIHGKPCPCQNPPMVRGSIRFSTLSPRMKW
jgi:hypothetical protein